MLHRHLNHQRLTLAAIDNIIGRGKKLDWRELRAEVVRDPSLLDKVLRIKGVLILQRNATRDYLDFAALARHMGDEKVLGAFRSFDRLYPQPNDESALQQLQIQLANALPYDLEGFNLAEYKQLEPRWHDWRTVKAACADCANLLFARGEELEAARESGEREDRVHQGGEGLG